MWTDRSASLGTQIPLNFQLTAKRAPTVLGFTSLFLKDPVTELSVEKWLALVPSFSTVISKPICLRVAVSFTVLSPAPHVLHIVCSQLFPKSSCFFLLPEKFDMPRAWCMSLMKLVQCCSASKWVHSPCPQLFSRKWVITTFQFFLCGLIAYHLCEAQKNVCMTEWLMIYEVRIIRYSQSMNEVVLVLPLFHAIEFMVVHALV